MGSPALPTHHADLLIQLLEAEQRALASGGETDRFAWHRQGGMGPALLLHRGATEDETVDADGMEALIASGHLHRTGQRAAVFTAVGLQYAERLQRERLARAPVDVTWPTVEPVLQTLLELWTEHGAPSIGVSVDVVAARVGEPAAAIERMLDLLEDAGWVQKRTPGFISPGGSGPTFSPSAQTLRRFAGWPAGDEGPGPRFLAALQAELDETDDDDRRSRLSALLDSAKRVGEGTLTQVLSRLATGQIHF